MARTHSVLHIRIDGKDAFLLCVRGERGAPDFVFESGRAPSFPRLSECVAFARRTGRVIEEDEIPRFDLDAVAAWCIAADVTRVDGAALAEAWDLFAALARSAVDDELRRFLGDGAADALRGKLRSEGALDPDEERALRRMLGHGLSGFRRYVALRS